MTANSVIEMIGSNNTFNGNTASAHGGVIYNQGSVTIGKTGAVNVFDRNTATNNGGAIANTEPTSQLKLEGESNTFTNNVAAYGGVIYNSNGKVEIVGSSSFEENEATTGNGGAIASYGADSTLTIDGESHAFTKNTSANYGGAVYNIGTMSLKGAVSFSENTAKNSGNGGAIYNNGTLTVVGDSAEFKKNQARGGGAIYNNNTLLLGNEVSQLTDIVFEDNKSEASDM